VQLRCLDVFSVLRFFVVARCPTELMDAFDQAAFADADGGAADVADEAATRHFEPG
jgi:hypothetical protein